jgi:hypothetical protein
MEEKTYITFIDNAGRSIFGALAEETSDAIKVQNPVMIGVQQQENGQLSVQLFPLFFAEFVAPASDDAARNNYFTYSKSAIATGTGFDVDPRISAQYEKIVNPALVPVNAPTDDSEVIKLFDD